MLYTLVLRIQLEVVQSLLVSKFVIEHTILSLGRHISTEKPSKRDPIDSLSSFEGRFSDSSLTSTSSSPTVVVSNRNNDTGTR